MKESIRWLAFIIIFLAIAGCSNNDTTDKYHYYFSLMGEGDIWEVQSYQLEITPESVKAGNGKVVMKGKSEYLTDSYSMRVYAVFNEKEEVIQADAATGNVDFDITQISTGYIESTDGEFFEPAKISNIYMEIEWKDTESEEWLVEKIELFNKETFSN